MLAIERILRSCGGRYRWWSLGLAAAVALGVLGAASTTSAADAATSTTPDRAIEAGGTTVDVSGLAARAERARRLWDEVGTYYQRHVAPLARVILQYRDEPELARRVAVALVRHANAVRLEPRLLLAVLLVENPWIDPAARSSVGAVGLMQVMPRHQGKWGSCAPDLEDIESNICHGARIFAHNFRREGGDLERALLRYNGCVRGTNTPDCHRYPYHVYARAGRASILAWMRPGPARAASP